MGDELEKLTLGHGYGCLPVEFGANDVKRDPFAPAPRNPETNRHFRGAKIGAGAKVLDGLEKRGQAAF